VVGAVVGVWARAEVANVTTQKQSSALPQVPTRVKMFLSIIVVHLFAIPLFELLQ
jgi:hypothetical protein